MERTWKSGKPALMLGLVLLVLGMVLAACGEEEANLGSRGSTAPTATPATTPAPEGIDYPRGDTDVVVKIEHVGGFVMQEHLVTRLPLFTMLGDGSVITQGPQIAIYPAPALPNLQMGTLTDEGIQQILEAARDAGLLDGDKEYRLDIVADAAWTVYTITADGKTHTVRVYAAEMIGEDMASDTLSEEEIEARQKIADFQAKVIDYTGWLPDEAIDSDQQPFPTEQLQVVTLPRDVYPAQDEDLDTGEMDWPLEAPLAETGEEYTFMDGARCTVIEGEELDTLTGALQDANQQTTWTSDGEEYGLLIRPLLPGDEGCAEPQVSP